MNINKPTEVTEENLTDVVNHIYDVLNKLAQEIEQLKGE